MPLCHRNKNIHSKVRKKLSGQIFPFLLVGIVALLAVALSAQGMFSSAKTRTCADNAADAGSLATASILAGAFNELCLRNEEMWDYYELDLEYYRTMYALADTYLTDADTFSVAAKNTASAALPNIRDGGCETWTWQKDASLQNYNPDGEINSAAEYALEAAKCVGAVEVLNLYMLFLTDNYKYNQTENYCRALDFMNSVFTMNDYFTDAKSVGLKYAFNNSCQGSDALSFWLGTGGFKDGTTWPPGADTSPNGCGITVTVDLPALKSFEVEHTLWNYPHIKTLTYAGVTCDPDLEIPSYSFPNDPFNVEGAYRLKEIYKLFYLALKTAAANGMVIYNYTDGARMVHDTCHDEFGNPYNCNEHCNKEEDIATARSLVEPLRSYQSCLINALNDLNSHDGGVLSIHNLKELNFSIYNNVWKSISASLFSSKTCEDVKVPGDQDEAGPWPGLMITKIDEVKLTWADWVTNCTVVVFCRHTDERTGRVTVNKVTAFSQAEFNVDNLGVLRTFTDLFDTQIKEARIF